MRRYGASVIGLLRVRSLREVYYTFNLWTSLKFKIFLIFRTAAQFERLLYVSSSDIDSARSLSGLFLPAERLSLGHRASEDARLVADESDPQQPKDIRQLHPDRRQIGTYRYSV